MKRILLVFILVAIAMLYATPVYAASISVVALPNPIGIPEILLVVALLGFALWKTSWIRILLSVCIVIWGVFFMPYDVKVAAPLLAAGVVLFIQATLKQIQHAREGTE